MESNEELKKPVNRKPIIITAAIAAAVCIVIAAVIFAKGGSAEKRLAEQLDLAERYLSELDYEQAIAAYKAAIEIDPKCEEAYLGLADAYIGLEDYEAAIEALESGIEETASEMLTEYLAEVNVEYSQIEAARLEEEAAGTAEEVVAGSAGTAEEEVAAEAVGSAEGSAAEGEASTEEETVGEEELSAEEAAAAAAEAAAAGSVPYTVEMAAIAAASVGDIVYWGSYEQDNNLGNGTEPVAWYVLDKADGEATLLAVYLLDCQQYYEDWEIITWENCTLRSWLNSDFYNTAFSAEEQAAIVNANVVTEDVVDDWDGSTIDGGNDTVDKVWLLSRGEAEKYFHIDWNGFYFDWEEGGIDEYGFERSIYCYGQDHRVCAKPTAYAEARGVEVFSKEDAQNVMEWSGCDMSYAIGSGRWWLRSPGRNSYEVDTVSGWYGVGHDGDVACVSAPNFFGVRPALKVAY